jgi:uncharacterized protein YsxB (DUF464 family)
MTRIIYERDEFTVTVYGHSAYSEKGEDIVCAGITALTEAMLQRVDGRQAWQPAFGINKQKAIVRVHLTPKTRYATETAREMLDTICGGYRIIARQFPKCVRYEER